MGFKMQKLDFLYPNERVLITSGRWKNHKGYILRTTLDSNNETIFPEYKIQLDNTFIIVCDSHEVEKIEEHKVGDKFTVKHKPEEKLTVTEILKDHYVLSASESHTHGIYYSVEKSKFALHFNKLEI